MTPTETGTPDKAWPHMAMQGKTKGDGAAGTITEVETPRTRSVIDTLKDMRQQDTNDYDQIICALTQYAKQRRVDLEQFERWLGIK